MGGSEFMELFFDTVGGKCPDIDIEFEKQVHHVCLELISRKLVKSAHDVSVGGLAVTIAESCIYGNIGANVDSILTDNDNDFLKTFYSEPQSQIVFSSHPEDFKEIEFICSEAEIPFERIGKVKSKNIRVNSFINIELEEIKNIYNSSIEKIMAY